MEKRSFVVYGLYEEDRLRYVGFTGKSPQKRLAEHLAENRRCRRTNWLKSMVLQGRQIRQRVLVHCKDRDRAAHMEKLVIAMFRSHGHDLVNGTDGGDGFPGGKHSAETRAKISDANKGEKNKFFGKTHTAESRARMSASLMGRPGAHTGKRFPEDHKKKLSLSHKGLKTWNAGKTMFDVVEIRSMHAAGVTQAKISQVIGMSQSTVSRIINFKRGFA